MKFIFGEQSARKAKRRDDRYDEWLNAVVNLYQRRSRDKKRAVSKLQAYKITGNYAIRRRTGKTSQIVTLG